jgi:hypothetical protein
MTRQHPIAHDKQGFLQGTVISLKAEQHIANIDSGITEVKHAIQQLSRAVLHQPIQPRRYNTHAAQVPNAQVGTRQEPNTRRSPVLAPQVPKVRRQRSPTQASQHTSPVNDSNTIDPTRDTKGRFIKQNRPAVLPYGVSDSKRISRAMAQQNKASQAAHKGLLGFLKLRQRQDGKAQQKTDGILTKLLAKPVAVIGRGAGRVASGGLGLLDDVAGGGLSLAGGLGRGTFGILKRMPILGKVLALGGLAMTARATLADDSTDEPSSQTRQQTFAKGAGGLLGGSLGMWGGAAAGAALGSIIPVIGTAIGGVAGAIAGGVGGEGMGEAVGEWLYQRDWKNGWDKLRRQMSHTSSNAWERFSMLWPSTARNLEVTFESLKTTFLANADQMFSRISDWYEQAAQWAQTHITQPFSDGLNGAPSKHDGLMASVASSVGSGARQAGDWIKSHNPFSYDGLKLKAGATNGGGTANGVTAMAHAVNGRFGSDVLRHASLNDRFHHNVGYHSLHKDGLGFDTTFKSANDMQAKGLYKGKNIAAAQRYQEIKAYVESLGFTVGGKGSDIELLDEYNRQSKDATGGHIHFAFRNQAAAKRYEAMVRGDIAKPNPAQPATGMLSSARNYVREKFGLTPKHSADKNANVKAQGARRADAALDFTGGSINGLSDAQTRALMASKQETEANFKADTVNRSGYLGLYQFGAAALEDIGLIKQGASKAGNAAMNDAANWTMAGGKAAFLNNKTLQDQMAVKYANLLQRGIRAGALNKSSSAEAKAGYIKAAWLKGNGGANDWVLRGKDSKDGMGTSASKYYNDGVNAVKFDAPILQAASVPSIRYDVPKAPTSQTSTSSPTKLNTDKTKTRTVHPTAQATQEVSDRGLAHIASGEIGRGLGVS